MRKNRTASLRGVGRFGCVAIPKGLAGIVQLAVNLLLIRTLGPDRVGLLFVCLTIILIADAVLGSSVDTGVLRLTTGGGSVDSDVAHRVQKAALVAKLAAVVVCVIPLFFLGGALSLLVFRSAEYGELFLMTALALAATLAFRSVQTFFQLKGEFVRYGLSESVQSVVKFGLAVWLIYAGAATPMRILACYAAGPLVAAVAVFGSGGTGIIAARFSVDCLRDLFAHVKWYLCAGAVGVLTSRMDLLLVSSQEGTRAAGIYSAAQVLVLVFHVAGTYMGVVCSPKVLPLLNDGRLAGIYWRFQSVIATFCLGMLVSVPYALHRFGGILPASYGDARPVAIALLPSALMSLLNFPWTITLLLFFHPRLMFLTELLALPMLFLSYSGWIASHGALGAAWVTTAYAVAKTMLLQALAWRTIHRSSSQVAGLATTSQP